MSYFGLNNSRIPHEIVLTDPLVSSLMRIAETRPFLDEYLGSPQEVMLLRKAKIRAVTYSNQIEGNELGESEVTAILRGKHVAGAPRDIKEVQNYYAALDYTEQLARDPRPLRLADMCDIHRLVTEGVIQEKFCGQIRTVPVSIVNAATGTKIQDCPEPHVLRELLDELWRWLQDTQSMNAFARAFAFHFIAVAIHPFADGNGRTVRLMQHLLLLRSGQRLAQFVPSETAIMRNRDRYYAAIRQSRTLQKMHPILEFLGECFAVAAEEVVADGRRLLRDSAGKAPDARRRKLLSHAGRCSTFTIKDVIKWLPHVPRRTLERDLAALVDQGAILAIGERKARCYRLVVRADR